MIRITNGETGKDAFVIHDNNEITVNGKKIESEKEIKEALEKAKKTEEE